MKQKDAIEQDLASNYVIRRDYGSYFISTSMNWDQWVYQEHHFA